MAKYRLSDPIENVSNNLYGFVFVFSLNRVTDVSSIMYISLPKPLVV